MTVRYTPRARSDLKAIFEFIAKDNRQAAASVVDAIRRTVGLIGDRPYIGIKNARDPRFRSRRVPGLPFRVHYTIGERDVLILHVRHTSRRPWIAG